MGFKGFDEPLVEGKRIPINWFLIGECGSNWRGRLQEAEQLIQICAESGLTCAKFQAFRNEHVSKLPEEVRQEVLPCAITPSNVNDIYALCKKHKIAFGCTAFYPEAIAFLDRYVKFWKIRELDSRSVVRKGKSDLVDACLQTQKPVLISTQELPADNFYLFHPSIKWLICLPKYPTRMEEFPFWRLLTRAWNGVSLHIPDPLAPLTAAIMGANIIEMHVTISRNENYPDNPVSLTMEEIKQVTGSLKKLEKAQIRLSPDYSGLV